MQKDQVEFLINKSKKISKLLNCLSTPTRLMITCMLIEKNELSVGEIIDFIGTTKGNISQHLRILVDNGILDNRRTGNKVFYFIKDKNINKLITTLKKLYCPDFELNI